MKNRSFFGTRARLSALEREVEALRRRVEEGCLPHALLGEGDVPLSRVINEYLYGEEESHA